MSWALLVVATVAGALLGSGAMRVYCDMHPQAPAWNPRPILATEAPGQVRLYYRRCGKEGGVVCLVYREDGSPMMPTDKLEEDKPKLVSCRALWATVQMNECIPEGK